MLFLPARWFMVPDRLAPGPETVDVAETFAADGGGDGEGERP